MVAVNPDDPTTFPDPHTWASYVDYRSEKYRTHSTLGALKTSVGYFFDKGVARCDIRVYSWESIDEQWVQIHHFKTGERRDTLPLFKAKASRNKKPIKGPTEKQIEQTLESIARSASNT